MNVLVQMGISKSKLIIGIPMYGVSYTLTDPNNHGILAPTTGPGQAGPYTRQNGILAYYEVYHLSIHII